VGEGSADDTGTRDEDGSSARILELMGTTVDSEARVTGTLSTEE
jgi:hypothetical protein